jgi:hypothetical protein
MGSFGKSGDGSHVHRGCRGAGDDLCARVVLASPLGPALRDGGRPLLAPTPRWRMGFYGAGAFPNHQLGTP